MIKSIDHVRKKSEASILQDAQSAVLDNLWAAVMRYPRNFSIAVKRVRDTAKLQLMRHCTLPACKSVHKHFFQEIWDSETKSDLRMQRKEIAVKETVGLQGKSQSTMLGKIHKISLFSPHVPHFLWRG